MLVIGLVASLTSLAISASMDTILGMWIAIIPTALLNHNWSVLKALFADYVAEQGGSDSHMAIARSGAVGKLGMAIGLSFMAGPLLGTVVVKSYQEAILLSMGLTAFSGIFIFFLPAPKAPKAGASQAAAEKKRKASSGLMDFMRMPVLQTRGAQLLMLMRLTMALAFHMFAPVWQVSLKTRFDFGPMDHAKLMGMVGFSYALSQGLVAKPLIAYFGKDPTKLILLCISVLGGCRPFALKTSSVAVVYALYVPMVIALGVMNTAITTACSFLADGDQLGGLFGVMESVESIAGMVGPALGGLAVAALRGVGDLSAAAVPLALVAGYAACDPETNPNVLKTLKLELPTSKPTLSAPTGLPTLQPSPKPTGSATDHSRKPTYTPTTASPSPVPTTSPSKTPTGAPSEVRVKVRARSWEMAMALLSVLCLLCLGGATTRHGVTAEVGSELFAGGVEAKARAFRVEPGLLKPHGALEVSCPSIDELDQHQGVGQLALRPDGKVLASAGWDYRVRIFSAKSLKRLAVLRYHDASVNALDWSDDLLATGSKDTKVAVWRLRF